MKLVLPRTVALTVMLGREVDMGKDVESKDWCHAGGAYLGWGTEHKIGEVVACELCGKLVKLRAQLSRDFNNNPTYPRHKRGAPNA